MSPEQARGKPLDRRTDVWSFGCVLYELISHRAAFGAETTSDSLVKVLESEPNWSALPDDTPESIRRLLGRCLEKDITRRLRDIADARLDIIEAQSAPKAATGRTWPARRHRAMPWVLALLAVAIAIVAVRRSTTPAAIGAVSQLTFRLGNVGNARFAPDGKTVVYSAAWDGAPFRLYSTTRSDALSRQIDVPPADLLALSQRGQLALSIGRPAVDGWEPHGTLAVTALAGGAPRELYTDVVGADWSADGTTMALVRRNGDRARLEFPVGTTMHEAPLILPPRISPDGTRVCFFGGYGELMVGERGGTARRLAGDLGRGGHCAWTPDGREIWVEAGGGAMHMTLEALDLEGRRRTIASYTGMIRVEDIASDGAVLLSAGTLRYSVQAVGDTAGGDRDLTVFDATRLYHLSGDGQRALLWDNSPGARRDRVLLRSVDGSPPLAIGPGAPAAVSSDGAWVAVIGDGRSNQRIRDKLTLMPTRAGSAQTITLPIAIQPLYGSGTGRSDVARRAYDFSEDGTRLLIPDGSAPGRPSRVYVYDVPNDVATPITPEGITGPAVLSPDGRTVVVYEQSRLVAYSVDDHLKETLAGGPETGLVTAWSSDGRSLFVVEQADAVARVFRRDVATGRRDFVREVRAQSPAGVTGFEVFVSRNGRGFAYGTTLRLANLFVIEGLR